MPSTTSIRPSVDPVSTCLVISTHSQGQLITIKLDAISLASVLERDQPCLCINLDEVQASCFDFTKPSDPLEEVVISSFPFDEAVGMMDGLRHLRDWPSVIPIAKALGSLATHVVFKRLGRLLR